MAFSEWLEETTPDRREVVVCFDRRLLSELVVAQERLKAQANEGMLEKPAPARELEARIAELEAQVAEKSRTLVFEGLEWGRWRDLIAKHPPSPDQSSVFAQAVQLGFMPHAIENIAWNAETFVPAAIAASCTEPGITEHEASTLLRKGVAGVIERIWAAVLTVNLAGGNDPFVKPASAGESAETTPSGRKRRRP